MDGRVKVHIGLGVLINAVLLMNALTPVIDRYCRPRILGRRRDGRALERPAIDNAGGA